jgi:hypothetical protein
MTVSISGNDNALSRPSFQINNTFNVLSEHFIDATKKYENKLLRTD